MAVTRQMFEPLLNVPYSSDFNAIETLWSVSKNNYNKLWLMEKTDLEAEDFHKLVKQSVTMIPQRTIKGILKSNRGYLAKLLEQ